MWHSPFKLYLYPDNPDFEFSDSEIINRLHSLQFIEKDLSPNRYATGDQFINLLTFMGCSPNIELEPQTDKPFCYIEIESHKSIQLKYGINLKPAKCIHCKSAIKSFQNLSGSNFECQKCNSDLNFKSLNWRKSAFIAKSWICIGNIYELEAIPSDQLLGALKKITLQKWKYAYIREEAQEHL